MSKQGNEKENIILKLFKEALKMEVGTPAGKFNVFFTLLLLFFFTIYTANDVILTISYLIILKEKYQMVSFREASLPLLICGGLCFLYMIFLSHAKHKIDASNNSN